MGARQPTRRTILSAVGTVAGATLAGCISLRRNDGVRSFSYPKGFHRDGFDLDAAFGADSPLASIDSVTIIHDRQITIGGEQIESTAHRRVDAIDERFTTAEERFDELRTQLVLTDTYFGGHEVIERRKVEPRSLDFVYRARSHEFSRTGAYRLDELRELTDDVSFEAIAVTTRDDVDVVEYRAEKDDLGADSIIRSIASSLGAVVLEVVVDAEGMLRTVYLDVELGPDSDDPTSISGNWRYEGYGGTTVEPPDWLNAIEGIERPAVDISFDETPGEHVTVRIHSMANTEEVAVVLQEIGVVEVAQAPTSIVVPYETFVTEDGAVRTILVFAENQLRGPILIDSFTPTPPVR